MKIFKYLGIILFMVFSFYYTSKITLYLNEKNPIMINIKANKDQYKVEPVMATIEAETIIPGINGLEVNVSASYRNMKHKGEFDPNFYIFSDIFPNDRLKDNLDKTIIKGNENKKAVSFVIQNNKDVQNYFIKNNIKVNILTEEYFDIDGQLINGNTDEEKYFELETLLDKNNKNYNLCIVNSLNKELCQNNSKYLINPSLTLNNNNIIEIKNNLSNGNIILIKENVKTETIVLLLNEIKFKDLSIVYLSDLISEERKN